MRIGVPLSSVNCLEATGFFPFASGADAMRVPRPAAGMMATTFMAGCKYTRRQEPVQIRVTKGDVTLIVEKARGGKLALAYKRKPFLKRGPTPDGDDNLVQ